MILTLISEFAKALNTHNTRIRVCESKLVHFPEFQEGEQDPLQ